LIAREMNVRVLSFDNLNLFRIWVILSFVSVSANVYVYVPVAQLLWSFGIGGLSPRHEVLISLEVLQLWIFPSQTLNNLGHFGIVGCISALRLVDHGHRWHRVFESYTFDSWPWWCNRCFTPEKIGSVTFFRNLWAKERMSSLFNGFHILHIHHSVTALQLIDLILQLSGVPLAPYITEVLKPLLLSVVVILLITHVHSLFVEHIWVFVILMNHWVVVHLSGIQGHLICGNDLVLNAFHVGLVVFDSVWLLWFRLVYQFLYEI
jgi:hypothetical protein